MRNWVRILAFGVGLLGGITDSHALTVVHSNDVSGELEPCGCRSNPQGGVARKANFLKRIKDPFIIQLDAGDLLFPTEVIPDLLKDQSVVQAQYLLKAYDLMHHDVAVPGERDFALGLKVFEKLRKGTKVRYVAANLNKKSGGSLFKPHEIIKGKNADGKEIRVGIFGLVGTNLKWPKELSASATLAAAKKEVEYLKQNSDFIIALTHQEIEQDEKLAKEVPGIDLIVGGHSQSFLQTPRQVKATTILESSFRNQYVGSFPLVGAITRPLDIKSYLLEGLDAAYDSPTDSPSEMDKLVVEFKEAIAKINTEKEARLTAKAEAEFGSSVAKFHTFPKCAECHLKQFDFWRKTQHAMALESLAQKQQSKNKECLTCHTVGLGDPRGFSDLSQMGRLKELAQDPEMKEVKTEYALTVDELNFLLNGIRKASSLNSEIKIRQADSGSNEKPLKDVIASIEHSWSPVQCENCHSPGRGHPFLGTYTKAVDRNACLKCHTFARAPEWYQASGEPKWDLIEAKRKLITCPSGDITVVED